MTPSADVIVVGFGPVGAALAGLLGKRGLRVTVVERSRDVFPLPRAAHVDHTGLRTWQELGILGRILPEMRVNLGLDFVTAEGELLARVPADQASPSGLPSSMYFFQPTLDALVREVVSGLPTVEVLLGTTMVGLKHHDDHTVISAIDEDGSELELSGSWVVACDGATSRVRELLDIGLDDSGFEEPWLVVDLVLAGAVEAPDRAICSCDPARPTYSIPMPRGRHRFEFRLMEGDDPVEIVKPERIVELVSPWFAGGVVEVERSAIYTFHGLVADRWKDRRVLLAGDAVHQMPPFLGQGMCSGLRDAVNVAWKLAAVVEGVSPDTLLDSYEAERKVHASAFVDAAVAFGRVICVIDPAEAARRDAELLNDSRPPSHRLSFALPGLAPGPLILEGGGDLFVQPPLTESPLAGPRLDDYLGARFAVLTTRREQLETPVAQWWRGLGACVASVDDLPLEYRKAVRSWLGSRRCETVVVRPDRYTMWAGTDLEFATMRVAEVLTGSPFLIAEAS